MKTTRISVDSNGNQGDKGSYTPTISGDGRFVAFESSATNLTSGDTNNSWDIFFHDLLNKTTTRISVDNNGNQGNNTSSTPTISADGKFVAFESSASNLTPGDTNNTTDIFLRDILNKTTTRISVDSNGNQGNNSSFSPTISADGRFVAFYSSASNLTAGDTNGYADVFLHDRVNKTTTKISLATNGTQGNGFSYKSSISADGKFVVFESYASNLISGDTNGYADIFLHDRVNKTTTKISLDSNGNQGNGPSLAPKISGDGKFVAFHSYASNLISSDSNGQPDIFLRDLVNKTTTRISVNSNGSQGNNSSFSPTISGDGKFVAFYSSASNLTSGDSNNTMDIFLRDVVNKTTKLISVDSNGNQATSFSLTPAISANGRSVAFYSYASNLTTGDTNNIYDTFVYEDNSNINLPPTNLSLSNNRVAENQPIGTLIGNFTTTDPNVGNTFKYTLVSGTGSTDNSKFIISGNQLKTNAVFDYESKSSYSLRVQTQDNGGATFSKQLTISITDDPFDLVRIYGTNKNNYLIGTADADLIYGYDGNDSLYGNADQDILNGHAGNDNLFGGIGNDSLTGGIGQDNFIFNSPNENVDYISDFKVTDDSIQVKASTFGGGLTAGTTITSSQFFIGSGANDTSDRFIYNKTSGSLFFDKDGNQGTAQIKIASLSPNLALTNLDIIAI